MPDSLTAKLKVRATILCLRNGKVLLVRKKKAAWNLPGGRVELDESPLEAAVRELKEETRVECENLLFLTTLLVGTTRHHLFCVQVDERVRAVACNEIEECRWVRKDRLSEYDLTANALALVRTSIPVLAN